MEIIFTEFIFAYSLAECQKKVATIIFYFARAVSHATVQTRVGKFRQKNNSAEDGIGGTNGYFRRNFGCSAEQKISEFRSEPSRERKNNSEFRSAE